MYTLDRPGLYNLNNKVPLRTVHVPTEVLDVDVTPFSWLARKVYYFSLSLSLLLGGTSLFSLWRAEVQKKDQDHMLSLFLCFPYLRSGFSVFSPLFPSSVCLLSVCTFFN